MPEDRLDRYRSMRDFGATPEPAGHVDPGAGESRFVVQEHHATSLHWDLRLERDGVAVSWAVPKGIPPDPRQNHLAVHTEDHPLEYLDFRGDIPEGSYGAGQMGIWDRGTYEAEKFDDREVMVTFHGKRVRGRYVLFHTDGNQWMIHRMDPAEDPSRELLPSRFEITTAVEGPMPDDESAYGFEFEWPGQRLVVAVEGGRPTASAPDGSEVTGTWPELRDMGRAIGSLPVVLDGVVVTLGADGRPDTARLARRIGARSDSARRRLVRQAPGTFFAFDLLWLDGHVATALGYADRRRLLDGIDLAGPRWQTPPFHEAAGAALLSVAREQRLPGVIAKRLDSPYGPSGDRRWVRIAA